MSFPRFFCAAAALWLLTTAAGCRQENSWYCDDRAYNNCVNNPGEYPCTERADCTGQDGKPACSELSEETGTGICVQCTVRDAAACLGVTPVCGADNTCRSCSKHTDCASAVCMPDGSCGSDANVAYVAPNGTSSTCTKTAPCGTLGAAVTTGKATIKVAAGLVKSNATTVIDGKNVTIVAEEGSKVDRDGDDNPVIRVQGASDVKIYDLEVTGASGNGAHGIEVAAGGSPKLALTRVKLTGNQGLGLSVQGGSVAVSQSTISTNTGGGILISNATFVIANNFIYRNGNSAASTVGGLSLAPAANSKLEFNTIVDNEANAGSASAGGVFCDLPGFAAANNLIFRNTGGPTADLQTFGVCTYGNSFVRAGTSAVDNLPGFAHPNIAPFDYHLTAASPTTLLNAGGTCTGIDFDGEARPQGGACDLGADEHKAN